MAVRSPPINEKATNNLQKVRADTLRTMGCKTGRKRGGTNCSEKSEKRREIGCFWNKDQQACRKLAKKGAREKEKKWGFGGNEESSRLWGSRGCGIGNIN